ncbi:MAG: PQQ-like beta-propeller repeat protein [Bacteroidetes bacterium]|nr:PQQ-like beta-propeller repeat protein [Bacteroidota bacterium]
MQAQTLVNQLWKERTGHPTKAFDFMSATRTHSVTGSKGSADNVYVVGNTYHIGEEENAVVYKYTPTGSLVWTYEYNSVSDYRDFGIDIYCKNGLVYVTGVSWDSINNYSEIVVLALDETDGTEIWRSIYQPSYGGYAVPAGIQVDGNEFIYIAGTEQTDSAEFGLLTYAMKSDGTITWTTLYDSTSIYDGR